MPLSENNTPRVFYTYQNAIGKHTLMIRLASPDGVLADADAVVAALLSAIGSEFHQATIIGVEQAAQGSNVRFPASSARIGDFFGSGAATPDTNAQSATFVGKSEAGHIARISLFGYKDTISGYRKTIGEDTNVAAAVTALNAAEGAPSAIDGDQCQWKGYMNIKPNDHWVKKARQG